MPSLVIVGAQWGDEGKGKLVDFLTEKADLVVRFQGGNNAGHTLVVDGIKTKLSLIPSGVLRESSKCVIAAGVVVNPEVLLSEIEGLKKAGIEMTPEKLMIDRDAHIIFKYHILIDTAREQRKGDKKIGTTGRGIGPAYEDRASRVGIRFADLFDFAGLEQKLKENVELSNKYLKYVLDCPEQISFEEELERIKKHAALLKPYVVNAGLLLETSLKKEEHVLFEGAQGTLLDQTFGTIPFVTSSSTLAGAVSVGCGIGPQYIDYVLGVAKAYSTRVGSGPYPTEIQDEVGDTIRTNGAEFGTVTGRPRRCGWFDAVAMKKAVRLNGIDSLAITKLDVLSGLEKIKICVKYELDGKEISDMPSLSSELDRVKAKYIELDGWDSSIASATKWHEMPANARLYLNAISEILACPVTITSVGAERNSTIFSSGASFVKNFIN